MPDSHVEEALVVLQAAVDRLSSDNTKLLARIDQLVASHNQVGENVAWLTANTQGLFAMFNDPNFMNSMMSGMMGMMGGKPGAPKQG